MTNQDPAAPLYSELNALPTWESQIESLQRALAGLRAELEAAQQERDVFIAAAEDWQLAADGIKHHFGCANNMASGNPQGFICDRCRAEQAEVALAEHTRELEEANRRVEHLTEVWQRERLMLAVVGALKSAIDSHGPITQELKQSAAKRIVGALPPPDEERPR